MLKLTFHLISRGDVTFEDHKLPRLAAEWNRLRDKVYIRADEVTGGDVTDDSGAVVAHIAFDGTLNAEVFIERARAAYRERLLEKKPRTSEKRATALANAIDIRLIPDLSGEPEIAGRLQYEIDNRSDEDTQRRKRIAKRLGSVGHSLKLD